MSFDIFPLNDSPNLFKNKMARAVTPREKYDVVCELGGACCYAIYVYMNNAGKHGKVPQVLKALDRVARSIVMCSDGIQDGYRLSDYWLHTLFAQVVLNETPKEREQEALDNIRRLFTSCNWNYGEGVNPLYNNVNTLLTIEYFRKHDEDGTTVCSGDLKVVLYPTSEYPVGSIWRAKSGGEYTCIGNMEFEPNEPNNRGGYQIVKPTEYQLKKWERIA